VSVYSTVGVVCCACWGRAPTLEHLSTRTLYIVRYCLYLVRPLFVGLTYTGAGLEWD